MDMIFLALGILVLISWAVNSDSDREKFEKNWKELEKELDNR